MSDRAPITADLIMSTRPCERWPRAKIERVLAHLDCTSWTALAESARAAKWRLVSLTDLRLTAARYAAQHHRPLLVAWVQHVTRRRVAAYDDAAAAAAAAAAYDAYDAYDAYAAAAASDVATAAYAAAAAADASSWDGLRHLCGLLDGTVQP